MIAPVGVNLSPIPGIVLPPVPTPAPGAPSFSMPISTPGAPQVPLIPPMPPAMEQTQPRVEVPQTQGAPSVSNPPTQYRPEPSMDMPPIPPASVKPPSQAQLQAPPHRPSSGLEATAMSPLTPSPNAPDPLIGLTVGSFKLVRPLGRGGMGSVYLGEHPVIGSRVAIKFLHQALASNEDLVRRFYDEARAVNLIGHDNIVSIFDLNLLPPNRYYIVMEYLEGQTLANRLQKREMNLRVACEVLLQLCDALAAAHERNIVHRDLKPENVFLVNKGGSDHFVKLVDFGIAKLREQSETGHSETAPGILVGTPEYMSPEQCDNRPVDARSDLYSLGVMAFRLATGRLPFQDNNLARLMIAHLEKPPPPPRQLNPALSVAWEDALLQALSKEPEKRFQSAKEFSAALQNALLTLPAGPPVGVPNLTPIPQPRPDQPRHRAGFDVEVRGTSVPTRMLKAVDISKGGTFICTSGLLPPLFSQVKVSLPKVDGGKLEVVGEVVRHVSPAEAEAWNMEPGFAVQFVALSPEQRRSLERVVTDLPKASLAPTPAPTVPEDPVASEVLDYFRQRVSANHYELLGAPTDSDFAEVRHRARILEERLDGLGSRKVSVEQQAQMLAVRERVKTALTVLTDPKARADYDAQRGNFQGVARCLNNGLKEADLLAKHKLFASARPGLEARVQQHLGRIKLAKGRGNHPAALKEYEVALGLDPLNLELHKAYWALKRKLEGGDA